MEELSWMPESTVRLSFIQFVKGMKRLLLDTTVCYPKTPAGLRKIADVYDLLGLPGALGSCDCTQIPWSGCPAERQNICTGRYGYPTVSFLVICDHFGRILYCSNGYPGSTSDLTIAANDPFTRDIINGEYGLFKNHEFILFDDTGSPMKFMGAYLVTDQGFQKLSCFMSPEPIGAERYQVHFYFKIAICSCLLYIRFSLLSGLRASEKTSSVFLVY